jgi:hypothetical protein
MYYGGLVGGQVFFTQPGGPGTQVFPTQKNAVPWTDWPAAGVMVINEYVPYWSPGCLHSIKVIKLIPEWDYVNNVSVMLLCCQVCSYIQRYLTPQEEAYNSIQQAIIIM